jgi:Icc protein
MSSKVVSKNSSLNSVCFAQISDCHLYENKTEEHYGVNVFDNLLCVLLSIKQQAELQFIVFTGDLTQDHSSQSYQNFVAAFKQSQITLPVYYLAGNHDEEELFALHLTRTPFNSAKTIDLAHWQIQLIKSKSDSPAGIVDIKQNTELLSASASNKFQLLMMHHHPIDVGYFIDRHGLMNKTQFWQSLTQATSNNCNIKGIACGHVHNAMDLMPKETGYLLPLYTCPATSIQFDKQALTVASSGHTAGYRTFTLIDNGDIDTQVHFIEDQSNE